MKRGNLSLLIITIDENLFKTLGAKLQEWGATVCQHQPGENSAVKGGEFDLIFVDIRLQAEKALQHLKRILHDFSGTETILINSSSNISASIAGMRAGASDELLVPFDMGAVRKTVHAALDRRRSQNQKKRRSFLNLFEEAMSAATFAQAGDFNTALDILHGPGEKNSQQESGRKRSTRNSD